jgi:hypothetical protein
MAGRPFTCPIPRAELVPARLQPAALRMERVALKWRTIAEQRRDHYYELYATGRWKLYYDSGETFMKTMVAAIAAAERWAAIAPRPDELAEAAVAAALKPAA